jgi:uncharacterized protein with NRDE domain
MCLILIAWHAHPQYPLVLAANRDEVHARAAASAGWWNDHPQILAGRDLSAGGTWLGVTRQGRLAALTNYRAPGRVRDHAPSRGKLVEELLTGEATVEESLQRLQRCHADYNGFNVLFSDGERLAVFESVPGRGRVLASGVYGLSNHLLDTPWPKVEQAKSRLSAALGQLPVDAPLLQLLRDDLPAADGNLPRTGVSLEWERLLSSAFIRAPGYGTRCSTILCVDRAGFARFDEWTWDEQGDEHGRVRFEFEWASGALPRQE